MPTAENFIYQRIRISCLLKNHKLGEFECFQGQLGVFAKFGLRIDGAKRVEGMGLYHRPFIPSPPSTERQEFRIQL